MTVTAAATERVAILVTIAEWPEAENPNPP